MILLFGHDGQIGWELERRLSDLGEVFGVSYPEIDFSDVDSVRSIVQSKKPSLIVNASAYTQVDKAETDEDLARAVNAIAPGVIAEEAKALDSLLVHYSTDFVFDGSKGAPYWEDDEPNPLSVYGMTKLEGDQAVLKSGCKCLVFRTSWIYGNRGSNFMLTMKRLAGDGKEIKIVDDQIGAPSWCGEVARATVSVLSRVYGGNADLDIAEVGGLYNMACVGEASWFGFAKAFLDVDIEPIPSSEYPTPAKRPAYSVLDSKRLSSVFAVQMASWCDALKDCLSL